MIRWVAPAPTVALGRRSVSLFTTLGIVGYLTGGLAGVALSLATGRAVATIVGLQAVAAIVFFTVAMAGKVLTGRERLIYYHQEIAILVACAAVSWTLGRPVRSELDLVAIGIGVFLVFGRLGCAAAGCCHGRPAGGGIVYGAGHVRLGLRPELDGRALVPVQLLEAGGVAVLTTVCALLVLHDAAPGAALVTYLAGYGIGRWILELLRGDDRATWRGSSHTQWTALLVSVVVTALQACAVLPGRPPHLAVAAVLAGATVWRAIQAGGTDGPRRRTARGAGTPGAAGVRAPRQV
jgi:hypothetical protein